ncbi:MAG: SagB/ThcOx family dehydrogenase [bacterium]
MNGMIEPPIFKGYSKAKKIKLPDTFKYKGLCVEEAIRKRRSLRDFSLEPISLDELSLLLFCANGITSKAGLRASPSAGALYPIEIYPLINRVSEIPQGIYHYSVKDHSLEELKKGDFAKEFTEYCLGQDVIYKSAVSFIMSAIFERTKWKYKDRAYRYVLLEVGHISENIYLSTTSMGLGCCAIGAFFDDQINEALGLDGVKEASLLITSIGKI